MNPLPLLFTLAVLFIAAWASSTRSSIKPIRVWMFAHTIGICMFTVLLVMGVMDPNANWQDHLFTGVSAGFLIGYARIGPRV
jgi:hypothetical protein